MADNDKPKREIDLDQPGAEVSKLFIKLPQNRTVRNAQEAIAAYDQDRPVKRWFSENTITSYVASERVGK